MMASHAEMEVKGDETQQPKGKPYLDRMAQQMQNFFKFKNFYDQMDFSGHQRLAIRKAITELNDLS